MSLGLLANVAGVAAPGAGVAIHAGAVQQCISLLARWDAEHDALIRQAKSLAQAVQNVKVNKFQANELSRRCNQLAVACEEAGRHLPGTEFAAIVYEITAVIERANRRAREWAEMSAIKSFALQSSIRQGVESLFRDIETCTERFHIGAMAQIHKSQQEMDRIRERDKDENREMLRHILEHVVLERDKSSRPTQISSQSAIVIQTIKEILEVGPPEDGEFLRKQLRKILSDAGNDPLEYQIPSDLAPNNEERINVPPSQRARIDASHSRSPKKKFEELEPIDERAPLRTTRDAPVSPKLGKRWSKGAESNSQYGMVTKERRRLSDTSDFDYTGEEDDAEGIPHAATRRLVHESPLRHPVELPGESSLIDEQVRTLDRLGDKLDEKLQFGPFETRRHTIPNALLLSPHPLRTPEASDSAHSPGSSPQSLPSSFGSPVLRPRMRSASSSSSFVLEGSLLEFGDLDVTSVVHRNSKGYLTAATFSGMVDELLRKSLNGYQKTQDFQAIFLTCYRLLSSGSDSLRYLLRLLFRRFTLSESSSDPSFRVEDRVPIRHEVLVVLKLLLNRHYANALEPSVLEELLPAVQGILKSAMFASQSKDLVTSIEQLIAACNKPDRFRLARLAKPSVEQMHLVDFDHETIAYAMQLLEGAAYKAITPTDCITHLIDSNKPSPLSEALVMNKKIFNWVRRKVLSRDDFSERRKTLQTFISVAHECRLRRNFGSMSAILTAIDSPALSDLRTTRRSLDKEVIKILNSLKGTLDSFQNYHDYKKYLKGLSVKKDERRIPWLALHVEHLKQIYDKRNVYVMVDGRRMIDFEPFRTLSGEISDFLQYQDMHEFPSQQITFSALSYLEDELKKIKRGEQAEKTIAQLSLERQAEEDRDYNSW